MHNSQVLQIFYCFIVLFYQLLFLLFFYFLRESVVLRYKIIIQWQESSLERWEQYSSLLNPQPKILQLATIQVDYWNTGLMTISKSHRPCQREQHVSLANFKDKSSQVLLAIAKENTNFKSMIFGVWEVFLLNCYLCIFKDA